MEQRVSVVTLGVSDVDRSTQFYRRLGWKVATADPTVAFFQAGGMILAIYGKDDLADDAGLPAGDTTRCTIALAQNVRSKEEVDAVLAEADRAGGRISKRAEEKFWGGYSGYFTDPDGHPWEIAWNPHWKIEEDGSVRLSE